MALKLNRLTAKDVAAKTEDGRYADGGNLYLQIQNGSRSWVFIYSRRKWGIKQRGERGLGPLHTVGLAKARKLAEADRQLIADHIDPIPYHEEQRRKLALGTDPTFLQRAQEWMASKVEGDYPHWIEKTFMSHQRTLNNTRVRPLHNRVAKDITVDEVFRLLKPDWLSKPAASTKCRVLIEEVLKWAIAREGSQRLNPASMDGPLGTLLTGRQRPSKPLAALPYQLIPALMPEFDFTPRTFFTVGEAARACDLSYRTIYRAIMDCRLPATKAEVPLYRGAYQEWHIDPAVLFNVWPKKVDVIPGLPPVAFALIRFSVMTGQRPGEIASMCWPEWQRSDNLWILPWQRTKEGRKILQDQVIPLSPPCVEILTALEAQQKRDGIVTEFVFGNYITANMTSKIIGKPPCTHTILFHLRRKVPPEWQHATMHGMRTALRSWGDDQLKPDGVTRRFAEKDLERAIGHIAGFGSTAVSRLYSRDSIDIRPLIPIFNDYATFCLSPPADIVPFRKQAKKGA